MTDPTAWEQAYQRFETPAEERAKFVRRLRRLGVHHWDRASRVIEVCSGRGNGLVRGGGEAPLDTRVDELAHPLVDDTGRPGGRPAGIADINKG